MSELETIDKEIMSLIRKRVEILVKNSPESKTLLTAKSDRIEKRILKDLKIQEDTLKKNKTVGYLGPEGTFSHQMSLEVFSTAAELIPFKSIDDVFTEVAKGNIDNGIVPIENSINGSIVHTLDMLLQNIVSIQAEATLDINHCLFSNCSTDKITKIYSHSQPIGQCWQWLQKNYPKADYIETSSTTAAIQKALVEPDSAAIASKLSSDHYAIKLIKENIQDLAINQTRFLVIGEPINQVKGEYKTSISVTLKDRPGALFELLQAFQQENINLTRIESRPSRIEAWCYNFLIDFEGNTKDVKVIKVMEKLNSFVFSVNVLGSYRKVI